MAATWNISVCNDYLVGPAGPFEGEARVIYSVNWICADEQTVGDHTYAVGTSGEISLEPFTGGDFVAWDDVTKALALEWVHDKMGAEEVAAIEAQVAAQLHTNMNPTASSVRPWSVPEPAPAPEPEP